MQLCFGNLRQPRAPSCETTAFERLPFHGWRSNAAGSTASGLTADMGAA